jgi:UDP-glucose 4-epimerase
VDIRDGAAVEKAFAEARPERVFHLAAQISVRESVADPARDAEINVIGTVNVLEASRRHRVRRLVNASTGGPIYGPGAPRPTPETHPPNPKSPYGESKLAAEGYCALYARLHDVSTVSLRCGNVYGPRQDPDGEAGVVAIFCGKVHTGETATIFGDGQQERDFVYVGDVVAANLLAGESDVEAPMNIATGVGSSILELARMIGAQAGTRLPVEHGPERAGESRSTALDPSSAERLVGWRPQIQFEEGISRTLRSLRPD